VDEEPGLDAFVADRGDSLVRFAYVLTAGDEHRAQDLVQGALVKVMGKWPRICRGGNPEAYLHRVIVTEELSWRRRRSSTEVVTQMLPQRPTSGREDEVDDADEAWQLLRVLPRKQRAVLALRYFADWSDQQIAGALGCSEATVRSQASRALAALRAQLGRRPYEIRREGSSRDV
jgi:RNA polymerase sigma-70 factor (sigma-E family)